MSNREQVFVANFPYSKTEDDFKKMVEPYGPVANAYLLKNSCNDGGEPAHKGYGFVCCYNNQSAKKLVRELNGRIVDGRHIKVEFSKKIRHHRKTRNHQPLNQQNDSPKSDDRGTVVANYNGVPKLKLESCSHVQAQRNPHIFFGNVAYAVSIDCVRDLFRHYGEVKMCFLIPHGTLKRHKGYGFMRYVDPTNVQRAVEELNNRYVCTRKLDVDYSNWFKNTFPALFPTTW